MIHSISERSALETANFTDLHSYGSQLRLIYNQVILSTSVTSSKESYLFFRKIWDKDLISIQEQVYILFLNTNNQVISYRCLNTGTNNGTLFDIRLAMACALGCLAGKIIIAHNHPSGNLRPSAGDIETTEQLKSACLLMDIKLLDHLIINQFEFYSFGDHHMIL
jgi:DNA repair protein RadC